MVKRGQEPARGLWSIPGGKLEHGEYIEDALKREVKEETGIEIAVDKLVGVFEVLGNWGGDDHYVILDYLATSADASEPVAGDDAEEARWVPLDEVPTLDCTPRFVETLRSWGVLT
jgi:ADP-ribose pyrophosphatase YjhB (NUDIX family)